MKNWKKMIVTAAAFASLALFAGCTTASAVSLDEAKDLVKDRVGDANAVVIEQETDREDGVYELEIVIDGTVYEFEVDSRTGHVREVDRENIGAKPAQSVPAATQPAATQPAQSAPAATQPTQPAPTQPAAITLEEAKAIAYAHAGVSEADAWDKSYERDDGRYEIDFDHGGYEYEYDISLDGKILSSRKEKDRDHHGSHSTGHHGSHSTGHHAAPAPTQPAVPAPSQPAVSQSNRISAQEALTIALDHAGVSDARDRDVEWDDGRWEVSFDSGRTEYEYHISADGDILRWEKDHDD